MKHKIAHTLAEYFRSARDVKALEAVILKLEKLCINYAEENDSELTTDEAWHIFKRGHSSDIGGNSDDDNIGLQDDFEAWYKLNFIKDRCLHKYNKERFDLWLQKNCRYSNYETIEHKGKQYKIADIIKLYNVFKEETK